MAGLRVIIAPDGRIAVDNFLPHGTKCDDTDAELRAILELLGAPLEDVVETENRPAIPNGVAEKGKVGGK